MDDDVAPEQSGERQMRACVRGEVQGVGYRMFARREATARGLRGYVRNLPDTSVEVVAEGEVQRLVEYIAALRRGPSAARVSAVEVAWSAAEGRLAGFRIRM